VMLHAGGLRILQVYGTVKVHRIIAPLLFGILFKYLELSY